MRAELIATLVPLKWIRETGPGGEWLPADANAVPRFHVPVWNLGSQTESISDWSEGGTGASFVDEPKFKPIKGFNYRYGGENLIPLATEIKSDETLNAEQQLFVLATGYHLVPAVYLQSPAGSGKTSTLAKLAQTLAKHRPEDLVLAVASTNFATQGLARKIHKALGHGNAGQRSCTLELLMIKSQRAAVFDAATEDAETAEENEFLLSCNVEAHVEKILQDVESGEIPPGLISQANLEAARYYLEARKEYPGCLAKDTDMIKLILNVQKKLSIVVTTIDKAMQLARLFRRTRILLCDEAHQARTVDLQNLVWSTEVCQLAFAGDQKQLPPYAHRNFEQANPDQYAMFSIVEFFHKWLPGMTYTLRSVYRFNPMMVPVISYAFYGRQLIAAAKLEDRDFVETYRIPMSSSKVPITLIDVKDPPVSVMGKSLRNPAQEEVAKQLIVLISKVAETAPLQLCAGIQPQRTRWRNGQAAT